MGLEYCTEMLHAIQNVNNHPIIITVIVRDSVYVIFVYHCHLYGDLVKKGKGSNLNMADVHEAKQPIIIQEVLQLCIGIDDQFLRRKCQFHCVRKNTRGVECLHVLCQEGLQFQTFFPHSIVVVSAIQMATDREEKAIAILPATRCLDNSSILMKKAWPLQVEWSEESINVDAITWDLAK